MPSLFYRRFDSTMWKSLHCDRNNKRKTKVHSSRGRAATQARPVWTESIFVGTDMRIEFNRSGVRTFARVSSLKCCYTACVSSVSRALERSHRREKLVVSPGKNYVPSLNKAINHNNWQTENRINVNQDSQRGVNSKLLHKIEK